MVVLLLNTWLRLWLSNCNYLVSLFATNLGIDFFSKESYIAMRSAREELMEKRGRRQGFYPIENSGIWVTSTITNYIKILRFEKFTINRWFWNILFEISVNDVPKHSLYTIERFPYNVISTFILYKYKTSKHFCLSNYIWAEMVQLEALR